jgi:3-hydroxyacyl-CoA dehydrogenase
MLDAHKLLSESPDLIIGRIKFHSILEDAVAGAHLVQECVPEDLNMKIALFNELADLTSSNTVLASSTSTLMPSSFAHESSAPERIIVGHPGNPPYLLPVIEVVPHTETSREIIDLAVQTYRRAGLKPIMVNKEIEGFVFNRLQGAVLREAYCLVRDGVASVADIDEVMKSGLGRRWSFIGPFETSDLNTRGGIESHAAKMGAAYERMGAQRGQKDPWTPGLVKKITEERRSILPLEDWADRVKWRDEMLMKLLAVLDK